MRALLASGDREGARKTAEEILAKAPTHFGAKLLLARDAWLVGRDEAITTKLLGELEAPAVVANAAPNERVSALSLRGLVALSRGRVTDARKAFEEAIRVAQGASTEEPQTGLGEVFLASGQYPQAISAFNAATQAAPESTVAKIGVARALLRQEKASEAKAVLAPLKDPALAGEVGYWLGQAQEKIAPEKPSEAVAIYEAAIKAQPTDPKPYVALASLQAKSGKSAEADATLAQALAKVPPSDRLHLGIGDLRFRQERYDGALEQYDKALALQPENLEALFAKARTLLRMDRGRWEQAKAALDQVEAKDPHYPTLTLELGLYYQKTDQIEKALEKYKAALAGAPDDVDIKLMVARAQVEAHVREAEGDLRAVLDRCGSSATPDVCTNEAKHYLGRALLARGNPVEARQYLQQAVDRGDANAQYHLYLGWAQVELTQLEEAERSIERALELDKGLGNAHWLRAEILSKRGQHREAIDAARRALAITPTRSEAHATIGFGLKQLGLEDQAIAEYALAIKGDPRNPRSAWWRFQIADLHFHKGTTARALDEIRESIKLGKGLEPKPPWLAKAHFFLGEALRGSDKPGAIKAYQEYLETSIGLSDPARKDAKSALAELGAPWTGK
jgi:tetratricopeptide (TPR) repeat protein